MEKQIQKDCTRYTQLKQWNESDLYIIQLDESHIFQKNGIINLLQYKFFF